METMNWCIVDILLFAFIINAILLIKLTLNYLVHSPGKKPVEREENFKIVNIIISNSNYVNNQSLRSEQPAEF